jgi:hypothetical protein
VEVGGGGGSPACPDSRPKETKIILGRWGRGLRRWPGGGSKGGGAETPDSVPTRIVFSFPSPAAGAWGEAGKTVEFKSLESEDQESRLPGREGLQAG